MPCLMIYVILRAWIYALFDDRPTVPLKAFLGLVQGGDDGLAALAAFQEINGCGYLRQHGCKFKLALADIILCLFNAHMPDGLFILGAVVKGHILNAGEYHHHIRVNLLGQKPGCQILLDDGAGAP